ncbi:MAG TPA: CBS domain-containing protein [Clostridia bacterium]|nr:CBS domain-containing protein [Clostridia bacterium]
MKNIAFYLTPKINVVFEYKDASMRQLFEKMEHHRYTSIPILNEKGHYEGTITEGDILRKISKKDTISFKDMENLYVKDIKRSKLYSPVSIDADFKDLLNVIAHQNFVPVVDDQGVFIGIVTRSAILSSFEKLLAE